MRRRALLVAVDTTEGLLPPVVDARAELGAMRRWLVDERGLEPDDIIVCDGPAGAERTFGNSRDAIAAAVRKLVFDGADRTDELYVYFAAPGVYESESPFPRAVDALAACDFSTHGEGSRQVVPLVELQTYLALALGPGDHFYFVDAPRMPLPAHARRPSGLGLAPQRSLRGSADVFAVVAGRRLGEARGSLVAALRCGPAIGGRGAEPAAPGPLAPAVDGVAEPAARDAAFARLVRHLRSELPDREVEALCRPRQCASARAPALSSSPATDRATRRSLIVGEQILRWGTPDASPPPGGFDAVGDAASLLYFCATFRDPVRAQQVVVRPARLGATVEARAAAHRRFHLDPGPQVLEVLVPGWQALQIASCTLFGHVTVVVLADDDEGRLDLRQLILPIPHLVGRLPGPLRQPTRALRFMAEAQRRLARGLPVVADDDAWERGKWNDLVEGRWVDPILSLVAAYDLIRQGAGRHGDGALCVRAIVRALRTRHPGLPDTDVIARLVGMEAYPVAGWPLLLDGMMAVGDAARPLDTSLVCDGLWTMFRREAPSSQRRSEPERPALHP